MVKAYLRYELTSTWGVIASPGCNVCYDRSGRHLLTAALENVCVWKIKQAVVVSAGAGGWVQWQPARAGQALPALLHCCPALHLHTF